MGFFGKIKKKYTNYQRKRENVATKQRAADIVKYKQKAVLEKQRSKYEKHRLARTKYAKQVNQNKFAALNQAFGTPQGSGIGNGPSMGMVGGGNVIGGLNEIAMGPSPQRSATRPRPKRRKARYVIVERR